MLWFRSQSKYFSFFVAVIVATVLAAVAATVANVVPTSNNSGKDSTVINRKDVDFENIKSIFAEQFKRSSRVVTITSNRVPLSNRGTRVMTVPQANSTFISFSIFAKADCSGSPYQVITYSTNQCLGLRNSNIGAKSSSYEWDTSNNQLRRNYYSDSNCASSSPIVASSKPSLQLVGSENLCFNGFKWSTSATYVIPKGPSLEHR